MTPIADNIEGKPLNQFQVDVTLDVEAHRLLIHQELTYPNSTGSALHEPVSYTHLDVYKRQVQRFCGRRQ